MILTHKLCYLLLFWLSHPTKVLRKVKPDLCFENLSWQLKISKQNFGQGKRGHNFSFTMSKV